MKNTPTAQAKQKFLEALSRNMAVAEAARAAGISHTLAYQWRQKDAPFAAAWARIVTTRTHPPAAFIEPEFVHKDIRAWLAKYQLGPEVASLKLGVPLRTFHRWATGEIPCRVAALLKFRLQFPP